MASVTARGIVDVRNAVNLQRCSVKENSGSQTCLAGDTGGVEEVKKAKAVMANRCDPFAEDHPRQSGTAETGGSGDMEILGNADFPPDGSSEVRCPTRVY
jgi:hypothetical protein